MGVDELIAELEAASGPGDNLDQMIFAHDHGWSYPLTDAAYLDYCRNGASYTHNISYMLRLRPPGWRMQLAEWDHKRLRATGPWMCVFSPADGNGLDPAIFHTRCEHAPTMELAVCIAVLRTRKWVAENPS